MFKILLTKNFSNDTWEKMIAIKTPNQELMLISELGPVIKVGRDGVYMAEWKKVEADPEYYTDLFPEEGVHKNYEVVREGNKLVIKAGPMRVEVGTLVEY
jgi:hypothetical protein